MERQPTLCRTEERTHLVIHTLWLSQLLTKQWKELSLLQAPTTTWATDEKMVWNTTTMNYKILCIHIYMYTHILPPTTRGQLFYSPYNSKHLIRLSSIHNLYTPWASLLSFLSSDNCQAVHPKKIICATKKIPQKGEGWKLNLFP